MAPYLVRIGAPQQTQPFGTERMFTGLPQARRCVEDQTECLPQDTPTNLLLQS